MVYVLETIILIYKKCVIMQYHGFITAVKNLDELVNMVNIPNKSDTVKKVFYRARIANLQQYFGSIEGLKEKLRIALEFAQGADKIGFLDSPVGGSKDAIAEFFSTMVNKYGVHFTNYTAFYVLTKIDFSDPSQVAEALHGIFLFYVICNLFIYINIFQFTY